MTWVFDLPLVVSGPAVLLLLGAYSLGGLAFFRRRVLPKLRFVHDEGTFGAGMVSSIMVFYGIMVALVAVNVWSAYEGANAIISREATALNLIYRDVTSYPEPYRGQLQKLLADYTQYMIHESFPQMRKGIVPYSGIQYMTYFQKMLTSFEPKTEGQKILHAETLSAYNRLIEARRMRLDSVNTHLPGMFWIIVVFGALISLTSAFFFPIADERLHAVQVGLLTVFIGLVIFVILALDRPYRGDLGVSSEPYQLLYQQLMR